MADYIDHGVGQFVTQGSREYAAPLQNPKRLQLDAVALSGCGGPPWLAGARSEVAGAGIDANLQSRNFADRNRGGGGSM